MDTIRQRSVLQAVLLLTLAEHSEGISPEVVYDLIDRRYRFPDEWYRQIPRAEVDDEAKRRGYSDWREVPQALLIELVPTEPQWQNEIRWARNDLRKLDYLDASAPRGVWRLSAKGMQAAPSIAAQGLSREEEKILQSRREAVPSSPDPVLPTPGAGGGLRSELLTKLDLLTHSMPLEDLQLLVDIARSIRKRSLPESE